MLVMQMNTIGLSILEIEFKEAANFYFSNYKHPKTKLAKSASKSLAFIQGTGLEMVIQNFGLMYDADALRNAFFSMVHDHERIVN